MDGGIINPEQNKDGNAPNATKGLQKTMDSKKMKNTPETKTEAIDLYEVGIF